MATEPSWPRDPPTREAEFRSGNDADGHDSAQKLDTEDWEKFHGTVVAPNTAPERKRGQYAVSVRKREAMRGQE
jgi:hypothetical protein